MLVTLLVVLTKKNSLLKKLNEQKNICIFLTKIVPDNLLLNITCMSLIAF
jgi:hypothetical protein